MPSLSKQILDYVPEGKVVDRAQIALDADYDSIGRVLRKLVDDGKLVRVGRGRYRRRARGSTMSSNSIADRVARRVARSKRNVFLRRDFETFGSYDAVGRALRRVTAEGRLVRIGYGLHARAERSPVPGQPTPVVGIQRLAPAALNRLGKTVSHSGQTHHNHPVQTNTDRTAPGNAARRER